MSQGLPTPEIFPDIARDVNEAVALVDTMHVARIFWSGSILSPDVVMLSGASARKSGEHLDYHENIAAKEQVPRHL